MVFMVVNFRLLHLGGIDGSKDNGKKCDSYTSVDFKDSSSSNIDVSTNNCLSAQLRKVSYRSCNSSQLK
jgi:hypothetical protein